MISCIYPCSRCVSLQSSGTKNGSSSKALAGLILPYDTFGNNLDSQRRTVDVDLKKKDFKRAGEVLAELWNQLVIDNCLVTCECVKSSTTEPVAYKERWVAVYHSASYRL